MLKTFFSGAMDYTVFLFTSSTVLFGLIVLFFFIRWKRIDQNRAIGKDFFRLLSLVLLVYGVGCFVTQTIGNRTAERERKSIKQLASVVAAAINPERLKTFTGTLDDLKNQDYIRIREQLIYIQKSTQGIRWLYLMSRNEGGFLFTVDNIPLDTFGHIEPGQGYYEEAPPELFDVFKNGQSQIVGPYKDEWGTFVSGFSAIMDPKSGKVLMVLGVDMEARYWYLLLLKERISPIVITLLLVILVFFFFVERERILNSNRKLLVLQDHLKQRNKEIIEYTHTITHDLKKPLTGLKTILGVLRMGSGQQQVAQERIQELLTAGEASTALMHKMLEDLLVSAKLEWGGGEELLERIDVHGFVSEMMARFKIDFERANAILTFEGSGFLETDRRNLEALFTNLVGNALSYGCSAPNPAVFVSFEASDSWVRLLVKDNGRGIPERDRPLIFDRFKRGANVGECSGSGLGLYICKMAVQKMGGTLTVNCPDEGGTEFRWSVDYRT